MMKVAKKVARIPGVGATALFAYRGLLVCRQLLTTALALVRWLLASRETSNFTYDLTGLNKAHLCAFVAEVTGRSYADIANYVAELENDTDPRDHVRAAVLDHPTNADHVARFGRRLGWYAVARATRPRTIVETGVDKGLGSCVLTAALLRNAEDGYPGYYYGLDINPEAGYLFRGRYRQFGEIRYGDSLASLSQLETEIDLFINDSDHAAEYELAEYVTVNPRLNPNAVILGDNAHNTDCLLKFALATGRRFLFFHEVPDRHWYPGAGIGFAFRRP